MMHSVQRCYFFVEGSGSDTLNAAVPVMFFVTFFSCGVTAYCTNKS